MKRSIVLLFVILSFLLVGCESEAGKDRDNEDFLQGYWRADYAAHIIVQRLFNRHGNENADVLVGYALFEQDKVTIDIEAYNWDDLITHFKVQKSGTFSVERNKIMITDSETFSVSYIQFERGEFPDELTLMVGNWNIALTKPDGASGESDSPTGPEWE